ncbi:hypothetical protein BHE74_00045725 [Ensete ventricosum]|uniref:Uncharacterized protein n=1 Tax=Ensete ventricosum TaxID=4639 RepID=A0A427B1G8_ENSVE|nr:hypothetical protein B296_00013101 [Ensete ventricosum]RWW20908.1 hypothetical protein GW17_00014961 [Ensete ventricosum]RWW48243.1 hypothetical protein BHE74_00045725 [Ensete ventricosum]RZR89580.1 hypothetical protein BHM03_00017338 [Ensete ventricosum]
MLASAAWCVFCLHIEFMLLIQSKSHLRLHARMLPFAFYENKISNSDKKILLAEHVTPFFMASLPLGSTIGCLWGDL